MLLLESHKLANFTKRNNEIFNFVHFEGLIFKRHVNL